MGKHYYYDRLGIHTSQGLPVERRPLAGSKELLQYCIDGPDCSSGPQLLRSSPIMIAMMCIVADMI